MQNQLDNKAYAGFFTRFIAYGIDCILAYGIATLAKLPFSIAGAAGVSFLNKGILFQYSLLDIMKYVFVATYFVLLTYFSHSTPGKLLLHLEVQVEGKEWTFGNILYRETIGRFLSSLLCIGYLAVIVHPKHCGFHDMLCDTVVVYRGMTKEPKPQAENNAAKRTVETIPGQMSKPMQMQEGLQMREPEVTQLEGSQMEKEMTENGSEPL